MYINTNLDGLNSLLLEMGVVNLSRISLTQYVRIVMLHRFGLGPDINEDYLSLSDDDSAFSRILLPPLLNARLYPYQDIGYRWLCYMSKQTDGCLLGDEMGLGKTLQVIAFLLARHDAFNATSLVIAPVSLIENWKREINRFAPSLDVLVHHGPKRSGWAAELKCHDVIVMSYGSAISDLGMLKSEKWDVLVLDEAQAIKNPDSRRSIAVKAVPHHFGIAVSGTPFENHILDVWSIMNFAEPALLGDRDSFNKEYPDDLNGASKLETCVTPFILRRTVSQVGGDLPDKITIDVPLTLLNDEAESYECVRQAVVDELGSGSASLATLVRLRMFCTHPMVLVDKGPITEPLSFSPESLSAKYQYLLTLLDEIVARREKVLIFTSYKRMFSIFHYDLTKRYDAPLFEVDGSTPSDVRQPLVDAFSAVDGAAIFILNPTAAGTGLNITAASNVIHYNLEWNPAKEDQATARAYRRGQDKNVKVYKLYYAGTVEESIYSRMKQKREMADNAIVGTNGESSDREAIVRALSLSPIRS